MADDPVLSTTTGSAPLPGSPGQASPLLPGGAPMPDPAADVVDPSPDEPPLLADPPVGHEGGPASPA